MNIDIIAKVESIKPSELLEVVKRYIKKENKTDNIVFLNGIKFSIEFNQIGMVGIYNVVELI